MSCAGSDCGCFATRFFPTFRVVSNIWLLFRRFSPDLLLYQGFQLGCEDRKLIGRPRRYYRILLGRQWLNASLRHRNHPFQRWHGNGHALGRQWHPLLARPDVLGDCPVGESRNPS
jgi:hypothetical protein